MGKYIGTAIGFAVALIILFFGFFKTIFILFCALIGYIIGRVYDENRENFWDFINKILPGRF